MTTIQLIFGVPFVVIAALGFGFASISGIFAFVFFVGGVAMFIVDGISDWEIPSLMLVITVISASIGGVAFGVLQLIVWLTK